MKPATEEELQAGDLELVGMLPWASNYSLLARLSDGRLVTYKPRKGESPLWDFPSGTLCQREVAAYLVSEVAGWNLVPVTVLRDGPLGIGAVQEFIDHDSAITAFDLVGERDLELRSIAVFDLIINNADRKAGHVLLSADSSVWAVDHGICFHASPKLRTVLWDYAGDSLSSREVQLVEGTQMALARSPLCDRLAELLDQTELRAINQRIERILTSPVFPGPGPGRSYPWPPT